MSENELLNGLDEEQRKAVTLQTNIVVAAGAGSGKTKVLASRYAWLITKKGFSPEQILTLTFTNKAVSEMYSRIYRYLLDQGATDALKNFHKARISTLDSFSANIARTAAARYGISPDFKSDDIVLRDIARSTALRFVMDHREDPAIRTLLSEHKIRKLADEVFAKTVLKYSPISSPLQFAENLVLQKKEILMVWDIKTKELGEITCNIIAELHALEGKKKSIGLTESLGKILLKTPPLPLPDISPLLDQTLRSPNDDLVIRAAIKKYFGYYSSLLTSRTPGRYGEDYIPLVDFFRQLKGRSGDGLYHEMESIANNVLNFGLCVCVFKLIKQFQDEFAIKKRETGLLSFNDIAQLAVDALRDHPDIRKAYRDSLRMIMIDEFQDNNALQRDLIFLLADPAAMFFVGDEKQSIYRFRGADVSVFRSLGKEQDNIDLFHNYRSSPGLIAAFNYIFEKVFLPPGPDVADYEAKYNSIKSPQSTKDGILFEQIPLASFCFLNSEELTSDDTEGIKSRDLEAAFIAEKIRGMVTRKEKIPKRTDNGIELVECCWGDFAVLERSYTHQGSLEKYFREFDVPYSTDRPSGLFNDAPILDLRSYLRLLVYPEDRIAYAALIRSPFIRLSDLSLTVCMLAFNEDAANPEPFAEENEGLIPEEERGLYRRARERYNYFRELSRTLPIAELITKLWYGEAYRYETLWTESVQVYENLFDLFFNLAGESDRRGKSLAEFIEYLEDIINREDKPDDKDIPGEGESGVKILSIHKSKGLEFPVVFIFDCANSGNLRTQTDLVSRHEKYGLILDIPQAEELPLGGNYFREIFLEEEKAKDSAELRRLLYVAMTRAESRLFLTFTLPKQTKEEKKDWDMSSESFTEETIRHRLIQLDENSEGKRDTFLKLLQGILPDCPSSLCTLETIPVLSRADIAKRARHARDDKKPVKRSPVNQCEAALAAASFYEKAEIIPEGKAYPLSLPASKLVGDWGSGNEDQEGTSIPSPQSPVPILLDTLLEKTGFTPMDFGTLVHAVLEGRLKGQPFLIPTKIHSRLGEEKSLQSLVTVAQSMADNFLLSELGKRCAASCYRESEFSIVTSAVIEGRSVAVTGQIDLLFLDEDEVVVVDFKTDRIEQPEEHYAQLAAYCQATGDIFGKSVSAWLYYLRSGRAVNVTEELKALSLGPLFCPLDYLSV